jgi:hypothetical protein
LKIIADEEEKYAYSSVYLKNKVAGLEVTFENRDHAVFVNLYKLEDDKFPVYKTLKEYDNSDNGFDIFDFIDLRHPELRFSPFIKNKEDTVKKILDNYAISIDKCAGDVLNGNFSMFYKVREIVDKRRQEYRRQFK